MKSEVLDEMASWKLRTIVSSNIVNIAKGRAAFQNFCQVHTSSVFHRISDMQTCGLYKSRMTVSICPSLKLSASLTRTSVLLGLHLVILADVSLGSLSKALVSLALLLTGKSLESQYEPTLRNITVRMIRRLVAPLCAFASLGVLGGVAGPTQGTLQLRI